MHLKTQCSVTIFAAFVLIISTTANAALYKCKQPDGSILWSDKQCEGELLEQRVSKSNKSTTGSTQSRSATPAVNSIQDITHASHGVSFVQLDGFGSYRLADIKKQALAGNLKPVRDDFRPKNTKHKFIWDHEFTIEENGAGYLILAYTVDGMNYRVTPADEAEDRQAGVYNTHFDIDMLAVNDHAVKLGLENQSKLINSGFVHEVSWTWEHEGFDCAMEVGVVNYVSPHDFQWVCSIELE